MITDFKNKTAVLTGAGSGFGLECARIGARLGMNLVLADVQQDALDKAAAELLAAGAPVLAFKLDVSSAEQFEALGQATQARFGAPHFVFNNAGVGAGGLIWENTLKDWKWVLGVNVMGVVHGVRTFTPMMLEAANFRLVRKRISWVAHLQDVFHAGLHRLDGPGVAVDVEAIGSNAVKHELRDIGCCHLAAGHCLAGHGLAHHLAFGELGAGI